MSAARPKTISEQAFIGQRGVNLIEQRLLAMGYAWHAGNASLDAGIDGYIELRDPATGAARALLLQVQSKATSRPWVGETDTSLEYVCGERDLAYWLQGNAPVILVVSRPDTGEAYWVPVRGYFADPARRKARKVVFDKQRDAFDARARDALLALAVPADAGYYGAPPPVEEPIYSNLLRVTQLPPRVYTAQVTTADRQAFKQQLQAAGVRDIRWVLRGGRLLTVLDPSAPAWRGVVDRGTVEEHAGTEWGAADERARRDDFYDFADLLGRCLSTRLRRLGVRYSDEDRYYHFEATPDLKPLRLTYRSIQKGTARVVFNRYATKRGDVVREWYRHSAFAGRFLRYDGAWFLEIVPDYHFTSDGRQPLRFAESKRSGIKVLERNGTVLGQVVMWAELLRPDLGDLFSDPDPHLGFGDLERFTLDVGVNEGSWTRNEDAAERRKAALAWDALPLFRPEPSPYADDPTPAAPVRPSALDPDALDGAPEGSDPSAEGEATGPDGEVDVEELEVLDAMGADFVPEVAGGAADADGHSTASRSNRRSTVGGHRTGRGGGAHATGTGADTSEGELLGPKGSKPARSRPRRS